MADDDKDELEVLVAQLDELLNQGAVDDEEALEIAALAGMARRLGAAPDVLADARAWRDQRGGKELLDEAWDAVDLDAYVDVLEGLLDGDVDEAEVTEAVYDFDELMCAADWCGRAALVKKTGTLVERMIRAVPEPFSHLADDAATLARNPHVAMNLELYGFWLAIADAKAVEG